MQEGAGNMLATSAALLIACSSITPLQPRPMPVLTQELQDALQL